MSNGNISISLAHHCELLVQFSLL